MGHRQTAEALGPSLSLTAVVPRSPKNLTAFVMLSVVPNVTSGFANGAAYERLSSTTRYDTIVFWKCFFVFQNCFSFAGQVIRYNGILYDLHFDLSPWKELGS